MWYTPIVSFKVGELPVWEWFCLGGALVASALLGRLATFVTRRILDRLSHRAGWEAGRLLVKISRGPLRLLYTALFFGIVLTMLDEDAEIRNILIVGDQTVAILGCGWLLFRELDVAAHLLNRFCHGRYEDISKAMVPVIRRILKPVVAILVILVALQNMGVKVGGLLAGLGIGGVALAFAAQSTVENVFGSLSIALDRPFKIGDFVKVGDALGTIEDMGLRSTRIRTLDRTIISYPNAVLAKMLIENFSARDRMRLFQPMAIAYPTSSDRIRQAIEEIKRYLAADARVWPDAIVVRFTGYGTTALQLEVICWVLVSDFGVFTGIREELLFGIRDILAQCGVELAFRTLVQLFEPRDG